jgi:hypothetical protein
VYGSTVERSGRMEYRIRLSTAMLNVGHGPLELRGSTAHPDGTQDVLQRIYQDDGTAVDRLAGKFAFHPSHGHLHFEGFAAYNLREMLPDNGVGEIVATGGKTSFCLVDVDNYEGAIVGAPDRPRYQGCASVQGISVGWADIYEEGLPDQWITVTNVPEGLYWLEVVADPGNHINEVDETNNVVRIPINYVKPPEIAGDAFEPNDGGGVESDLGSAASRQIDHLSIHKPGNDDIYRWHAPRSGVLTVEARFEHAQGDLSLFVYASPLEEIGVSTGSDNVERVEVAVEAGRLYYFRVIGVDDAISPSYSLSLSVGDDQSEILADAHEPNNSLGQAAVVPSGDVELTELTIHSAVDEDYFHWNAPATGPLTVSTAFTNTEGNVELYIYNIAGNLVAASESDQDGESITIDSFAGQLYFIKVDGSGLAVSPNYALRIDGPEPMLGDTDLDSDVDTDDLNNVRNTFGASGPALGDADHDGDVDISDLNAVRNRFGAGQPTIASSRLRTDTRVTPWRAPTADGRNNLLDALFTLIGEKNYNNPIRDARRKPDARR